MAQCPRGVEARLAGHACSLSPGRSVSGLVNEGNDVPYHFPYHVPHHGDFRTARPKRLRFLLFNTLGKVASHARRTLLRLSAAAHHALLVAVRQRIAALAPA